MESILSFIAKTILAAFFTQKQIEIMVFEAIRKLERKIQKSSNKYDDQLLPLLQEVRKCLKQK